MKTVALVCALPREAAGPFALPGEAPRARCGARWAWREAGGARVAVFEGGMGTTNAAATTQLALDVAEPRAVVFFGIAGGLNPGLGVGDMVVASSLTRLDADRAIIAESAPHLVDFPGDARLVDACVRELRARGYQLAPSVADLAAAGALEGAPFGDDAAHGRRFVVGRVATSDLFSTDEPTLRHVRDGRLADCEEMEAAASAQVAARAGVPFVCVRCLSNVCGEAYGELDGAQGRLDATARAAAEVALGVAGRLAGA